MMYSHGTIVASATITTVKEDGSNVVQDVAVNDTLKNVVVADTAYVDRTIPELTVLGFTVRPRRVERGDVRVLDGVPTYLSDPDGEGYFGTVEELYEVKEILVKLPKEDSVPSAAAAAVLENIKTFDNTPYVLNDRIGEPGGNSTPADLVTTLLSIDTIKAFEVFTPNEDTADDGDNG